MMSFTLHSNFLADLEQRRPDSAALRDSKKLCRAGKVDLAVVSVIASGNQATGGAMRNYGPFGEKLQRVGLQGCKRTAAGHVLWLQLLASLPVIVVSEASPHASKRRRAETGQDEAVTVFSELPNSSRSSEL